MESCTVCLETNEDGNLPLIELASEELGNVTYLSKLEALMYTKIIVYNSAMICNTCAVDLNNAYEFREKVAKALDHWGKQFQECTDIQNEQDEDPDKSEDCIEIIDNNFISEFTCKKDEDIDATIETPTEDVDDKTEVISEDITLSSDKNDSMFSTTCELTNDNVCLIENDDIKEEVEVSENGNKIEQKPESYDCKLCDLSFSKKWKLNKHSKVHGFNVEKKYTCKYCNRTFKQSYHLWEHETSHTGARHFTCNVCNKSFQRLSSQRRHMRTHKAPPGKKSRKSPFLCSICGKSFPYSNGAQRHMRIHTGDKRYQCEFCSRQFNQSTHLKVHLRMHTGEKPYRCKLCGDAFSLKVSLHKHVDNHKKKSEDVKIFLNLEPNLSQTEAREDEDYDEKKDQYIDDIHLYNDEFLVE